jgi:hypothetical protein
VPEVLTRSPSGCKPRAWVRIEITATGTEKVLYSFTGGADGALPDAALVMDGNGSLYRTTFGGSASGFGYSGYGTVFKLVP